VQPLLTHQARLNPNPTTSTNPGHPNPKVAAARARPPIGPTANKRGAHEAALRKWLEALEAANAQLRGLGREGHVNLLRQQVRPGARSTGSSGFGSGRPLPWLEQQPFWRA